MANLNKETKSVLGTAADKIGNYKESTGGGDPLRKGENFKVADTPEEAERMRQQDPNTKVRVNQPRNSDGTFGYNSQNARKLKYGPSRGKTVPDFLRGVDLLFLEKGTSLVMQGENSIEYYLSTITMSKDQLVENCKHYVESTEGFAGLHKGMMERKKGRHSQDELSRGQQLQNTRQTKDTSNRDYKGQTPTGVVSAKAKPKLSANTLQKINAANIDYNKIEQALKGIDADQPGMLSSWGTTNYNKAGATPQQVTDRQNWRASLAANQNQPVPAARSTTAPGGGTPIAKQQAQPVTQQQPAKQPVAVGAGGPSAPQYKASNFQGKNISSSKMGKIANLFGNILKK